MEFHNAHLHHRSLVLRNTAIILLISSSEWTNSVFEFLHAKNRTNQIVPILRIGSVKSCDSTISVLCPAGVLSTMDVICLTSNVRMYVYVRMGCRGGSVAVSERVCVCACVCVCLCVCVCAHTCVCFGSRSK